MEWYYAVGAERVGPVSEAVLQRLVQEGVVTARTLVWREGMANWQPYGGSAPPMLAANPEGAAGVVCAGCQGLFPSGEVITLDGRVYCAACKPLAVQRLKEGVSPSSAAEGIRNEYLKHEASVKSVGLLYYLGGAGMTLLGIGTMLMLADENARGTSVVGSVLFLFLGLGQFWVGTGLRRLKPWARVPTGILSGLGLLGFPLGTVINAYILYLVFGQKGKTVFSDEYRAVIEQTPHIKYRTSVVVWVLLGLVLALLGLGVVFAVFMGRH